MSVDTNTAICPKRGMDVVLNTPIDKGFEEPRFNTIRLDMCSPFLVVTKEKSYLPDAEHQSEVVLIAKETCAHLKTEMINLLRKVYEPSAYHAVINDLDDTDAGGFIELISNFQVRLESLLEQYNKHSAKVTQLDPSSMLPRILPNDLSTEVWQSAKQAVKEKISLKYEENATLYSIIYVYGTSVQF